MLDAHRSVLLHAATAAFTFLSIQGCGGSGSSASPTSTPTDAASPTAECKPLVERVDRLYSMGEGADKPSDPLNTAGPLRMAAEAAAAAAKDIDALTPQNAEVKALAKDYAAHVREKQKLLETMLPMMERLDAAGVKMKEADDASKALLQPCEKERGGKPSAACMKKVEEASKLVTEPAIRFGEARAAVTVFLQDPENKKTDERLSAADKALDERLHSVCGRPLPSEETRK
ncbi:MAG: hypothetical protein KF901_34375 [Myxococcales bacterium]|nr:hypothetical protein [Myxococcales bacterium]